MKNKDKVIIVVLVVVLVICCVFVGYITSMKGENNENDKYLTLSCDNDEIKMNQTLTCYLKGNRPNYEVSAFSSTLEDGVNFKVEEITPDKSFKGDGENGDIDLYTDNNKKGKFAILSFQIKLVNQDYDKINIILRENSFFDEKFEQHSLSNISKTIKVKK